MKGKSWLKNLIPFYSKVTWLVNEGMGVTVMFQYFSKVLDTVLDTWIHGILLGRLSNRFMLREW